MKKLLYPLAFTLTIFLILYSCSTEEEDTTPPPSVVATPEPEPPAPTQYTLTVTAGEGGTVSTEGGTYDEGTEVTITATPEEGYEFVGWEGSVSESNSLSITLNGNTTVQALFQKKRFSLIKSIIEGEADKVVTGFTFMGLIPFDDNNIFFNPTRFFTYPTYPMLHIKRDSTWKLHRVYDDMHFQVIRDYKKLDEDNFVVADQGLEIGQEDRDAVVDLGILDMGETYHLNFENDVLTRNTLSSNRGFFHSIDAGDLDNDSKIDVISMYMALPEGIEDNNQGTRMYMYSENGIGNFEFTDTTNKIETLDWESTFSGAVLIDEFTGDNQLDLIKFSYKTPIGFETREEFLYSYELLSYSEESKKVESLHRKSRFEEYPLNFGIAWARADDIDNDGDKDVIVHMEKGSGIDKIQVWKNDGVGNFEFYQEVFDEFSDFNSRDFEVFDFDNDGDLDLFLQPFGSIEYPINFSNYIYENNNGTFEKYRNDFVYDEEYVDMYMLKFMVREGNPHFIGIEEAPAGQLKFYEFKLDLN